MKAISICQPWASAIVAGIKQVENRTWATTHRGPILIHASLSTRWFGIIEPALLDAIESRCGDMRGLVRGAIIGVANIEAIEDVDTIRRRMPEQAEWAFGPLCWVLKDPRRFGSPIACSGRLSLWDFPDDKIKQFLRR
jgi:hypothetical protein